MSDNADVVYTIRADSSRLETDLNAAENAVRQSAQRTEKAVEEISEAAQRSDKAVSDSAKNTAQSVQNTAEALNDAAEAAVDSAEEVGNAARQTEQSFSNISEAAEAVGESASEAAGAVGESARITAEALDSMGQSAERVGATTTEAIDKTIEAGKNAGEKLPAVFMKIGKAVGAAAAAAGTAAAAIGTAAVNSADSLDKAVKRISAATGAGADAAEKYSDVIKGVYGDNFGDSFESIAADISTITQNLGDMDAEQLKKVTESAYALQDAFDMDAAESSRAAKAMQENFGISADKAYDYIAKGAQDGLNYSGELLDNISEYSVQFKKLGFDADDMFTIFAEGAENGAWNLDKIGDAVKEFSIRAIDGSDTTKKGFEALGYDAEDMAKKFGEGGDTARAAFQTVIKALGDMEDPIAQSEAGVNLFGTMWEDLGVDAVKALGEITDSAYDCAGTVDDIVEVSYSSLSDALSGLKRKAELLAEWYDEFNDFFRQMGANLYEMLHADEIEQAKLDEKYSGLGNDVIRRCNELMRNGMTSEQAYKQALGEIVNTSEKSYYWNNNFADSITAEETESRRRQMEENGSLTPNYYLPTNAPKGSSWYTDYYKNGANLPTSSKSATALNNSTVSPAPAATYKPYTPTADATAKSSKSTTSGGSGSGGSTISITSYVPTIWDNDQTAALKSLIGKDVLGKTATAHQINSLTGALGQGTAAKSGETTLADVVNAITKLHHKVEKMDDAIGDVTIVLKARDLTIGKAAVRDINDMAKQSGKSPFTF